ncbi:MAG TPA: recombination mediator RecR [Thermoanaerobaculia bacterium]|jgi:recombination protein RecR|nr:recombination mediator RecR [Thermoanaerobaculia bacterium]
MAGTPRSLERLTAEFQRLPGIGAKSAARLAYYLLRSSDEESERLAGAIREARAAVRRCSVCNTLTEEDPCEICSDPRRDAGILCVIEEPGNLVAIEKTREFKGRYHVLWGALSPLKGIGPDQIDVAGLVARVTPEVKEVVIATNPNVEGEATALYLARRLKAAGVRITRIAFGLPVGGDIEYADEVTMARSMENRREL